MQVAGKNTSHHFRYQHHLRAIVCIKMSLFRDESASIAADDSEDDEHDEGEVVSVMLLLLMKMTMMMMMMMIVMVMVTSLLEMPAP